MTFDELIQLAREQSSEIQRDKELFLKKSHKFISKMNQHTKTYFQMFGY